MSSLDAARGELRRLTSARPFRLATLVICLVPLLYGVLYLWAFWDPYQRLDKLPVAVVNLDLPTTSDGATVHAGADLVAKLQRSDSFDWHNVSAAEATRGLGKGDYYMALTIPRDFSASIASAGGDTPRKAQLRVESEEGRNLLATQIGGRVFTEVRDSLAVTVSRHSLSRIFVGLTRIHRGLQTGGNGAGSLAGGLRRATAGTSTLASGLSRAHSGGGALAQGLTSLSQGSRTLSRGTSGLAAGAAKLSDGASSAADGADSLTGGSRRLATGSAAVATGLGDLSSNAQTLARAATDLHTGASSVAAGTDQLATQSAQAAAAAQSLDAAAARVNDALTAYAAAHPDAADDAAFKAALAGQQQLKAGLTQLSSSLSAGTPDAKRLAAGAQEVKGGSGSLAAGLSVYDQGVAQALAGAREVAAGTGTLSQAVGHLDSGLARVRTGAADVAAGSQEVAAGGADVADGAATADRGARVFVVGLDALATGGTRLERGLSTLTSGATTLRRGLSSAARRVPDYGPQARHVHVAVMAEPVTLTTQRLDPVPNYGTGFAPYFIPLAMWIGALITFFIVRPLSGRALASPLSDTRVALAGLLPATFVTALQAVILIVVLELTLGLAPVRPAALVVFTLVSAFTFTTILQWLSAAFGTAGKFGAIVLLMLQLTSSAGTFPLQTTPRFFQVINPYLPMTYVVEGLRQAISGGDMALLARDTVILLGFALMGIGATVLTAHRRRLWTMDRLQPLAGI